jgi:stage V sporulation protein R
MRLFHHIEELADKGKYSLDFRKQNDAVVRKDYDTKAMKGRDFIFHVRENYGDSTFINTFVDQDFVDRNRLFVTGRRMNNERMVWEYYVKSRDAGQYRHMLRESLYHPPFIEIDPEKEGDDNTLYLRHRCEEKPLVKEYLQNTMLGIEYLWGGPVQLETNEVKSVSSSSSDSTGVTNPAAPPTVSWERVVYTMQNRSMLRRVLD